MDKNYDEIKPMMDRQKKQFITLVASLESANLLGIIVIILFCCL